MTQTFGATLDDAENQKRANCWKARANLRQFPQRKERTSRPTPTLRLRRQVQAALRRRILLAPSQIESNVEYHLEIIVIHHCVFICCVRAGFVLQKYAAVLVHMVYCHRQSIAVADGWPIEPFHV